MNQNLQTLQQPPATQLVNFLAYIDATPRTAETYRRAITQFFNYLIDNNITRPTRKDVIRYRESLKLRELKPTTIQSYITAIRLFFRWAEHSECYPNIADRIKGAKIDRAFKKDNLTLNQLRALLDSVDRSTLKGLRNYLIILLMSVGGLRDIEISRANINDLRTLGNTSVLYIQGKGKQERAEYIKIPPELCEILKQYVAQLDAKNSHSPLFFSFSNNSYGRRLSTRTISGLIKKQLVEINCTSSRLTAHSLRHTAITLALLEGQTLEEVQQFARHSNINTTMIYNHSLEKIKNGCSTAIFTAITRQ